MINMECCSVSSCRNYLRFDPTVDLYPLPVKPEESSLWIDAFGLNAKQINASTRICGLHFRRKYFLKKNTNPTFNVTDTVLLQNGQRILSNNMIPQYGSNYVLNNTNYAPAPTNNGFIYVTFNKDQHANTSLEFPQVKNIANVIPSPIISQEVSFEPKDVVLPNLISLEESSNTFCSEALQPLTVDSCELSLYCKEESLTPEQQKFHADEWMTYVKFTTKTHNLPHVSAVNGSKIGEQASTGSASQELPLLVYSNSAQPPQSLVAPVPNTAPSNAVILQIPPKTSSPLNVPSAIVAHSNIPSGVSNQPSVFPVLLEKNTNKSNSTLSSEEEILPFILQDSSTLNLLNKIKEASSVINSSSLSKNDQLSEDVSKNDVDKCISPDLLCNVEVNFEENDSDSTMSGVDGPDVASDGSNGPKIINVISGDAGASEFFKDAFTEKFVEKDSKSVKDSDNSSDQNASSSPESCMPKTVSQYSIFSMQKTIAVISSGTIEASIHNLLGVRPHIPGNYPERDFASKLRNQLRHENFITCSPWWMIQKRFMPLNSPCTGCRGKVFRLNSCYEYLDGLCWTCDNVKCRKIYPVKRPKFFDRFPSFSLEELLLLTYHWACKSRIWVIVKDVPVHEERIWNYFLALQEICGTYVSRNCAIGKNTKNNITVEVSAVKLGKFFILCAYDRKNKLTRLQALTTEEACGSIKHIQILEQWLGNQCTLITWKKISDEFLPDILKLNADPAIGHVQSPGRHILNASKYLGKTMVQLFQNINHEQITIETLNAILNEVQWRERNGRTEESAFWNIMNEISRLNDSYIYTEAILGEISNDRFFHKADLSFRQRWGPHESAHNSVLKRPVEANKVVLKNAGVPSLIVTNNSSAPPVAVASKVVGNDIKSPKPLHPISVIGIVPASNLKEKELISSRELLSVKINFPDDKGNIDNDKVQAYNRIQAGSLGLKLKREGFLANPVRWFVKNKFIKDETSCYVCMGKSKLVDNPRYPEGVSWLCQKTHCRFDNRYKRPMFFAHFGFKMEVILAAVFHWAVQSDYNTMVKSIPLNEFNIISVHRKLQKICSEVSVREYFKIGGKKALVEVAFVRFANCFILGAMERAAKMSRFRTFSIEMKLHIDEIRTTLISWLRSGSTVIVNSNKYLGRYCMEEKINLVFADKTVTDITSDKYHTLTITNYLQSHIKTMFRSLKAQNLSAELLQVYLDELIWRERYGKTSVDAFQYIMRDIFAVEYGVTSVTPNNEEMIKQAASFYGFTLPLPKMKIALERLPDHVINSYTSPVSVDADPVVDSDPAIDSDPDEVIIVDDVDPKKNIKVEVISDSEDEEEEVIEVVDIVPEVVDMAPEVVDVAPEVVDVAAEVEVGPSTSSSSSVNGQSDDTQPYFLAEKPSVASTSKSELSVNKSDENRRYSNKCYSHKKKEVEQCSNWKLQCVECKDSVTIDHFAKPYECIDCKHSVYTTFCQKSFARHRAYILFGRQIPESSNTGPKKFLMSQEWFCLCGFSSFEGNELASHLIKCNKTTCYLNLPSDIL